MILIFSIDGYDQCTDAVIDWLLYYGADFLKISPKDIYSNKGKWLIDVNNRSVLYNNEDLSDKVKAVWYRKCPVPFDIIQGGNSCMNTEMAFEYRGIVNYLSYIFKDKYSLGRINQDFLDKMETLNVAQQVGFAIPSTIITNDVDRILKFRDFYQVINKQINGYIKNIYYEGKNTYTCSTHSINDIDIKQGDVGFPSLFQKFYGRKEEIRVTYVEGWIYATSYLDLYDKAIDKKHVLTSNHMHVTPYKLDEDTCEKIRRFMRAVNLNYGALDFMVGSDGQLIFLEVNPSGQFLYESLLCCYNIEQYIAELLIAQDKAC